MNKTMRTKSNKMHLPMYEPSKMRGAEQNETWMCEKGFYL